MTELKQLERDAQNINGLNEHGSYCECIWCIEEQTRHVAQPEMEQRNDGNAEGFTSIYGSRS